MSLSLALSHGPVCPSDSCPCKNMRLKESIWYAASTNDVAMIRQRLAERPELANLPDPYGYTAVHFAAQRNHVDALNCLLSHGALPDGGTVPHISEEKLHTGSNRGISSGTEAGTKLLSGRPRVCKATPLHRAAYSGALEACELLVASGARLDMRDTSFRDDRTAIMKAASQQNEEIVALLLQAGADGTLKDAGGRTYLDILDLTEDGCEKSAEAVVLCSFAGSEDDPRSVTTDLSPDLHDPLVSGPDVLTNNKDLTTFRDGANNSHGSTCQSSLSSSSSSDIADYVLSSSSSPYTRGSQCFKCGKFALAMAMVGGHRYCMTCKYK